MADSLTIYTFWNNPGATLTFIFLSFAIISLWLYKTPWIWGGLGALSITLGVRAKLIDSGGIIAIVCLLLGFILLTLDIPKLARMVLVLATALASLAFMVHYMPGFNNWLLSKKLTLSSRSMPYNLYWNFDKGLLGLMILGVYHTIASGPKEWNRILVRSLPIAMGGIVILMIFAYRYGFIDFDPKLTWIFFPWAFSNFFFVTIPEEAFYRGFLQKEITALIKNRFAPLFGIILVSLLFAGLHLLFINSFKYALLAFLAGIIYGAAYEWTRSVEGPILCHFLFNAVHFVFFTYPQAIPLSAG